MRLVAIFAATLAALLALATPARAGMEEDCVQKYDLDLRIGGGTAAIRSGQWHGKDLAWRRYGARARAMGKPMDFGHLKGNG